MGRIIPLDDWHKLMEQSGITIDFWMKRGEDAGLKNPKDLLAFADLALREFQNTTNAKIAECLVEAIEGAAATIAAGRGRDE